jgi:hypothetical protein
MHIFTTSPLYANPRYFDSEGNMKELGTEQLCKGKKVVLFAVPGAFTPTCSMKHLPGFIERAEEIKVGWGGGGQRQGGEGGVRVQHMQVQMHVLGEVALVGLRHH